MVGETGLLERAAQLESLTTAIERAVDGAGSVALIEGEAGIGKTELLRASCEIASDAGLTVLTARASELERDYGFGVVRQLFQSPLAEMAVDARAQALSGAAAMTASILDDRGDGPRAGADADVFPRLHGLHWLCANLALTQPLMLAIDDLQWSDLASLRFLHYLAGRIEGLPVVAVATLRTGEPDVPDALLTQLRVASSAEVIRPAALSLDASVSFLRERIAADAEPGFCAACYKAAGGNPLLLSELVRALVSERIAPTEVEAGRVTEIGARGLAESLLARIDRLAPEAAPSSRAVAILEPHATLRRVAVATGLEPEVVSAAVHALVEAGVLRDGSPLAFVHPLLRSAVEGGMTEPQRRELHAAVARLHHAEGGDPGVVAAHLVKTDTAAGPWVIASLRAATEQALARGAPEPAVSFMRRALEEGAPEDERTELMWVLGSSLLRAGDEEGILWLKRAREASEDAEFRAGIAEELGPSLMLRARTKEAVALAAESIAELAGRNPRAELLLRAAVVRSFLGGYADALGEPYDELRAAVADLTADSLEERLALQSVAMAGALGRETAPEARRQALRALNDDDAVRAAAAFGRSLNVAAAALGICGDLEEALRLSDIGLEEMRRRAAVFGVSSNVVGHAALRLARGDVARAEADAAEASQLAEAFPAVRLGAGGVLIATALERGRVDDAERLLNEHGLAGELPPMVFFVGMGQIARARLRLLQGRGEEALSDLSVAADALGGLGTFGPDLLPPRLHVPLALIAVGRDGEARREAEKHEAWACETQNPRLVGEAQRVRGLVDPNAGIAALQEAVEHLAPAEFQLDHARALVDLGAALRRGNERRASRDPLRQGMDIAHRCGATALVERARTELEASGARPRSVFVSGVDSLTPSELRVAELAVQGMTNREIAQRLFVTMKTVETHLRHCYQKLEIAGRRELAAALAAPESVATTP
jgi:DNA-binding CsgD family transcriptional regulator